MPTAQMQRRHSRLLAIETPTALGHTSTLTILDASTAPHRINAPLLRREVEARLDELPMLRQSLVDVPLGLDRPWWRDHPGFDLDYHLRHIAVPDPDDPTSLAELVARIHSRPLDRYRPLWELYLISGLADGHVALLFKMHLAALAESTGNSLCAGLIGDSADLLSETQPRRRTTPPGGHRSQDRRCTRSALVRGSTQSSIPSVPSAPSPERSTPFPGCAASSTLRWP